MFRVTVIFCPAHPRAGGENSLTRFLVPVARGSSPRGRGKLALVQVNGAGKRLIPARAGKTLWPPSASSPSRAHPRAGGENGIMVEQHTGELGSSPRGRGKLNATGPALTGTGLIPARAGKTVTACSDGYGHKAHPRAGGENALSVCFGALAAGSSPRGRGKRKAHANRRKSARLIPARAGKTHPKRHPKLTRRAHPRAGGENRVDRLTDRVLSGSSPRGRGKLLLAAIQSSGLRLIPARAGKTGS